MTNPVAYFFPHINNMVTRKKVPTGFVEKIYFIIIVSVKKANKTVLDAQLRNISNMLSVPIESIDQKT